MDCRFIKTVYRLEWLLSIKWHETMILFSQIRRGCEEIDQHSFMLLYCIFCQVRLRHHKRSQSGWLVTQLVFKQGAWKLQIRNITSCTSCLVDIRQVFGTSKVLYILLALHLRSVANLISQSCRWMLLEYYKLNDIFHVDCVGKEDTLTHHTASAHTSGSVSTTG